MKTINRNVLRLLPLLALVPVYSQAQTAAQAPAPASTTIAIECGHRYISQSDAARVLRTDNFSDTYAKRQSLYANVARACHSGVRQVLLVTEVPAESHRTLASR